MKRWMLWASILFFVISTVGLILYSSTQHKHVLILAHNLPTDHPVHLALDHFAKKVLEDSKGEVWIRIYPNAQLGQERETIELVQLGAVALTKVSSYSLEGFAPTYTVLNLPFVFLDQKHFYQSLDSSIGEEILQSTRPKKFVGLTFFTAGARSFYAAKPIMKPEDLQGLKMRVMSSQTSIQMTKAMGGNPAPLSFGEVYTALQQGVIDGAENNVFALTLNRHGEVSKHYSLDEHSMPPDVLIISDRTWNSLSPEHQSILKAAAQSAKEYQRQLWDEQEKLAYAEIAKMGVAVHHPDKKAFVDKVEPIYAEASLRLPVVGELLKQIKALRPKE
jgi:tripartite ATP-independent transporter DctP family solute receptor